MKHFWTRITRQSLVIVILLLASIALLACGPAAEPTAEGTGPVTQAEGTPEPTAAPTQGPPAIHPTDTPKPPPLEPPTPKPTKPPRPTPTREPGDVAPPTYTPEPTPVPITPDPPPAYPEHPDGLEGCKSLNRFSSTREEILYMYWCYDTATVHVRDTCRGTGTTWEEQQCAYREIEDFKDYGFREVIGPCVAISERGARQECFAGTAEAAHAHNRNLILVWNDIVAAVDADPEVKVRYRAMVECVRGAEHKPPDPSYPLSWQQIDESKIELKQYRGPDEKEAANRRLRAVNQCALDTGLYQAQDDAWRAEIWRIFQENPDRIAPLKFEGVIDLLDEPGPAPFLTIKQFMDR